VGIDAREEWVAYWDATLQDSRVSGKVSLHRADVRDVAGAFDLVVSNPPFFPRGTGPTAPDPWKAAARTESTATLADFVEATRPSITSGGRACCALPIERESEALGHLGRVGAAVRRHVRVGRRRVLIEFALGSASVQPVALKEGDPMVRGWYATATTAKG
jgi:tRNA1Val (adenine37-N6)-methyltransferase